MQDGNSSAAAGRRRLVAQVERVASLEARIAALHAAQISVLADLQVDPHVEDHGVDLVDELAPRLRWTSFTAARRLVTADRVASCFPLLLEELTGGEVDYHRVDVVVREAELLDEEQALVLDAVLAGRLPGLTTTQIKDLVRREISLIDSDAVKERARRVVAGRRACLTPLADGQALLELLGPAPSLRAVYDRLDALAKDASRPGAATDPYARYGDEGGAATPTALPGGPVPVPAADARGSDARGVDAKRFDAAVEMVLAPVVGATGVATGTGPQITVAWSAATGLDDGPAHLAGHGAVPAELVRHLLRSRGFRCVATDPVTGHVVAADGHVHPVGSLPHRDDLLRAAGRFATGTSSERRTPARLATDPSSAVGTAAVPARGAGEPPEPGAGERAADGPQDDRWATDGPHAAEASAAASDSAGGSTAATGSAGGSTGASDSAGGSHPIGAGHAQEAPDAPRPRHRADLVDDAGDPGRTWSEEDELAEQQAGDDRAVPVQQDEFVVTLDISRLRAATLVNPLRVDDVEDWRRRADLRARSAVGRCPVAASPERAYRFPTAVRRLLLARSPTCSAPGCRAPAHRCDLDHTVEFAAGGPTCPCNAGPLCRRHHTARHDRGWYVTRTHDDPRDPTLTWLSPLGYVYSASPEPALPPVSHHVVQHLVERRRARASSRRELARRPVITGSAQTGRPQPSTRPGATVGAGTGGSAGAVAEAGADREAGADAEAEAGTSASAAAGAGAAPGSGAGPAADAGLAAGSGASSAASAGPAAGPGASPAASAGPAAGPGAGPAAGAQPGTAAAAGAAVPPHAVDHAWDRDCARCDPVGHRVPRPEAAGGRRAAAAPPPLARTARDGDPDAPPF